MDMRLRCARDAIAEMLVMPAEPVDSMVPGLEQKPQCPQVKCLPVLVCLGGDSMAFSND